MRKIHWTLDTGFAGCKYEDTEILDDDWDDATEEEIGDYVYDCILNCISWTWEEVE